MKTHLLKLSHIVSLHLQPQSTDSEHTNVIYGTKCGQLHSLCYATITSFITISFFRTSSNSLFLAFSDPNYSALTYNFDLVVFYVLRTWVQHCFNFLLPFYLHALFPAVSHSWNVFWIPFYRPYSLIFQITSKPFLQNLPLKEQSKAHGNQKCVQIWQLIA